MRTQRRLHPALVPRPEDDAPSNNLLSRISLATPPLRVGRSSASYIYEPAPEPEFVEANDEEPDEPQESGERFYEVCETVAGRSLVRHSSPSLFGATDYALELHTRSRGAGIEVLRVRDDVVWGVPDPEHVDGRPKDPSRRSRHSTSSATRSRAGRGRRGNRLRLQDPDRPVPTLDRPARPRFETDA